MVQWIDNSNFRFSDHDGKLKLPFEARQTSSAFMRRLTSYTGILLLSLILSGSGNVLAAAFFCSHAQLPACCRTKTMQDSMPSHDMMMDGMDMPKTDAEREADSISKPSELCAHCMGHSDLPAKAVAAVNSAEQSKRNLSAGILTHAQRSPISSVASFAPLLSARPHAPPGPALRRHVLVSTFLI